MASLIPPQPPKGHRRVKSLAREFEEIAKTGPPTPAVPTLAPLSTTPPPHSTVSRTPTASPSSTHYVPSPTHARRAASVSYSSSPSSTSPSAALPSPPFTFKSSAFLGPNITRKASFEAPGVVPINGHAPPSPSGAVHSHKRKASVFTPPPPPPPPPPHAVSEEEPVAGEEAAVAAEGDDVFLPLSPNPSSSPFGSRFPGVLPTPPKLGNPGFQTLEQQSHARRHSRIHERNLSVFFPRPGQEKGVGYGDTYEDPYAPPPRATVADIPRAAEDETERKISASRRGHHHRHSLSHAYFSFLDPTADPASPLYNSADAPSPLLTPADPTSTYAQTLHAPPPASLATSSYLPTPSHAIRSRYTRVPAPVRLILLSVTYLPRSTQLAVALSVAQVVLGATLWIRGQAGESLAVTGLGYLVVFDGMGGLSGVLVEGPKGGDGVWTLLRGRVEKDIRFPFGTKRLVTLSHFSQAIYLLFSAVYVCKESVEHVLLLHGGADDEGAHGAGHGGMGHGESGIGGGAGLGEIDAGIVLPVTLLILSALFTIISALALGNHQSLTEAVGLSGLSISNRPRSRSALDLVGNPFTLTVFLFSAGMAVAAFTIPSVQLAPLDKVVALLQSIAMFYIAYPAAVATGQVLLQTSPPETTAQMTAFSRGLQDVENHPLVVSVTPPHIWQLDPHSPTTPQMSSVIATLSILTKPDATDGDILFLTRYAQERCMAKAIGAESQFTVSVARAKRDGVVRFFDHPSMQAPGQGKPNDHLGHSHEGQSHGGGHSHQH